ncbi:MAG: class I SAM-dependent methyltransferase [Gammaproteobacteria bacterium]|nr:class I SAM-dependent methyltransferase [Gammaproteobacteria bacterium]
MNSHADFTYSGAEELLAMENMVNYNNHILGLLKKSKPDFECVVDFGAGIGTFAKLIRPFSKEFTCVEIDKNQQAKLQKMQFQVLDGLDKLPDNSQSLIYSINVLEHIEDDTAAATLIRDKLKPNGKLFLYVPAFNSIYSAMDTKVGHFRRYDKNSMQKLMQSAGLIIDEMYYADSLGYFASLAFKYCGNKAGEPSVKQLKFYDRVIFPLSRVLDIGFSYFLGKNVVVVASKGVEHE